MCAYNEKVVAIPGWLELDLKLVLSCVLNI